MEQLQENKPKTSLNQSQAQKLLRLLKVKEKMQQLLNKPNQSLTTSLNLQDNPKAKEAMLSAIKEKKAKQNG